MFQARIVLAIFLLGCIACLAYFIDTTKRNDATVFEEEKKEDLSAYLKPVAEAEKVTLYSIDGRYKKKVEGLYPNAEKFYGYPVLGELEVKKPQIQEMADALINGHLNSPHNQGSDCFSPRHALRTESKGKTTDYVICFECDWISVHSEGKSKSIVTTKKPQEVFDRILKEANIPIAP